MLSSGSALTGERSWQYLGSVGPNLRESFCRVNSVDTETVYNSEDMRR